MFLLQTKKEKEKKASDLTRSCEYGFQYQVENNMKSVLITGCSDGGIGSVLAVAFQARGFNVFATTRSTDKMRCLEPIENIFLLPLEVTSLSSTASAVDTVKTSSLLYTQCAAIFICKSAHYILLIIKFKIM